MTQTDQNTNDFKTCILTPEQDETLRSIFVYAWFAGHKTGSSLIVTDTNIANQIELDYNEWLKLMNTDQEDTNETA